MTEQVIGSCDSLVILTSVFWVIKFLVDQIQVYIRAGNSVSSEKTTKGRRLPTKRHVSIQG